MAIDSVMLLTNRMVLPAKPLSVLHLSVIVEAICAAWASMLSQWPTLVQEDKEAEVNGLLVSRLQVDLDDPSPFTSLVYNVLRGSEQYSFDGASCEKRPDLNFYLKRRNHRFPLVGECKIIDAANSQTVGKYQKNGIVRFVVGDYGWFGSQGIMVAYVRDATDAEGALARVTRTAPGRWPSRAGPHFQTSHDRTFQYVDRTPEEGTPGAVSLVHVWLPGAPREFLEAPGT